MTHPIVFGLRWVERGSLVRVLQYAYQDQHGELDWFDVPIIWLAEERSNTQLSDVTGTAKSS